MLNRNSKISAVVIYFKDNHSIGHTIFDIESITNIGTFSIQCPINQGCEYQVLICPIQHIKTHNNCICEMRYHISTKAHHGSYDQWARNLFLSKYVFINRCKAYANDQCVVEISLYLPITCVYLVKAFKIYPYCSTTFELYHCIITCSKCTVKTSRALSVICYTPGQNVTTCISNHSPL